MNAYAGNLSKPNIPEKLAELRRRYKEKGIPVMLDESLATLLCLVRAKNPRSILEIGTATGCSGIAMLLSSKGSLTTVETDSDAFCEAERNFEDFSLKDRVVQFYGDADEVLSSLSLTFDFVFLDGPKAHYSGYLPMIKNMLEKGGVLVADNVLFRGYVDPAAKFPRRFITIVKRMRRFLSAVTEDADFDSAVLDVGDGLLVAVRR